MTTNEPCECCQARFIEFVLDHPMVPDTSAGSGSGEPCSGGKKSIGAIRCAYWDGDDPGLTVDVYDPCEIHGDAQPGDCGKAVWDEVRQQYIIIELGRAGAGSGSGSGSGGSGSGSGSGATDCIDFSAHFGPSLCDDFPVTCNCFVEWRVVETGANVTYASGPIVDGILQNAASSTSSWNDADKVFCSSYDYDGFMELQIRCDGATW